MFYLSFTQHFEAEDCRRSQEKERNAKFFCLFQVARVLTWNIEVAKTKEKRKTATERAVSCLEETLLPSLQITVANPGVSYAVWKLLKKLPIEVYSSHLTALLAFNWPFKNSNLARR